MQQQDHIVLIAEDDATLRYLAKYQFKKLEIACDFAMNGEEAVDMCLKKHYDMILMDIHMPRMDGFEATKAIRKHENESASKLVPIVAMTANPQKDICYTAGMNDFLFKPFRLEDLEAMLKKWLKPS